MKHLKKFESFSNIEENVSLEDMKLYLCKCGYSEIDCEYMTPEEIKICYDECREIRNESKKHKPDFLDIDGDGDKKETMKKAYKDQKNSKATDKQKKKLPPALLKAIEKRKKK